MIVEVLRLIGKLLVISQCSKPIKNFILALILHQNSVALSHEVEFSFGMRRYPVLITDRRGALKKFHMEFKQYVLSILVTSKIEATNSCACPNQP